MGRGEGGKGREGKAGNREEGGGGPPRRRYLADLPADLAFAHCAKFASMSESEHHAACRESERNVQQNALAVVLEAGGGAGRGGKGRAGAGNVGFGSS